MKKTHVLLLWLLAGLAFIPLRMIGGAVYHRLTDSPQEAEAQYRDRIIEDYEEEVVFFRDERVDICFARRSYDGHTSYAPCDAVQNRLLTSFNPLVRRSRRSIRYLLDTEYGSCAAVGMISGDHTYIPIPCTKLFPGDWAGGGRYLFASLPPLQ